MSKHVLDRPRGESGARLSHFLIRERDMLPRGVSRLLHQRKRGTPETRAARLAIYTQIERRHQG